MIFGKSGIQFTISFDEGQLKTITEFIFAQLKQAKEDLEERIDELEEHYDEEIRLLKGKLP